MYERQASARAEERWGWNGHSRKQLGVHNNKQAVASLYPVIMSGRFKASGETETGIPLSEWIPHTLFVQQTCGGNKPKNNPSSEHYLIPALRVAFSLADQICKAEEADRFPTPSSEWIDSIVVHLQSKNPKEVAIENVFDTIFKDDGVIRAEILPSLFDKADNEAGQMGGVLYSLGIVFYQIFSGGERPAELELKQIEERPDAFENGTEEEDLFEGFDPFLQSGTVDLVGELGMHEHLLGDYKLSDDDSTSYEHDIGIGIGLLGDGPRKKRSQNESCNMCAVSVEPLKEKCLSGALCDLIANMLDCTNGTLRKDETYHDMSDVRDDLQLMFDKPSIYLHDQDMGRLTMTGLQFGDTVFGRNAELSTIKDAYRRTVSGDRELVTIYGQSGTGKSLLAHEFGKHVLSHGGVLLSGKFDQLEQGKPFSALASAFNQYCGTLLQNCELKQSKQKLTHQINHALGGEAYHLAKLIPNLATILGVELHSIIHDEGCIYARKRLQYLLCRFVEVISNSSAAPVTLFLDDLQWADSASIEAVNQLLLTGGLAAQNTSFFFLGCYREGETDNFNPLWRSLCNNNLVNARSTEVKLDCMDEHTLNRMVSETLCLSPRLTRTLSNVTYHKTKGNQLFVSRLLRALNKEGLLRPSLSRRRWEWNMKKIQSRGLPDDVAMFLTDSLRELPDKVQSALFVLSCFGASSESAFVESQGLDRNIFENLEIAVAEGLVDKIDDQYRFAHDRIQEAAYNTTPAHKRSVVHFKYGLELSSLLLGDEDT
eukprot:scaffold2926_cov109-Skeletonema_dohrnii-CCMP3373.AAC.14